MTLAHKAYKVQRDPQVLMVQMEQPVLQAQQAIQARKVYKGQPVPQEQQVRLALMEQTEQMVLREQPATRAHKAYKDPQELLVQPAQME